MQRATVSKNRYHHQRLPHLPVARCPLPFVFSLACDIPPPPPPRRDIWPNHLPPPVSRSTEHVRVRDCSLHDDFSSASSNSRKVLKSVANRRGDPLRFFLAISPMGPLRYREGKNKTVVGCLKNTAFAPEFVPSLVGGWILESPKNLSENIGGNSKDKQPRDELDDKQLCRLSTTAVGSHAIFVRFALIGELQTRQKSAKARLRDPAS